MQSIGRIGSRCGQLICYNPNNLLHSEIPHKCETNIITQRLLEAATLRGSGERASIPLGGGRGRDRQCRQHVGVGVSRMPEINWVGFYFFRGGQLVVGPFQGKPACTRLTLGKGVCGTAAVERETIVVPDVHQFPGHIACDSASASEIVIPM